MPTSPSSSSKKHINPFKRFLGGSSKSESNLKKKSQKEEEELQQNDEQLAELNDKIKVMEAQLEMLRIARDDDREKQKIELDQWKKEINNVEGKYELLRRKLDFKASLHEYYGALANSDAMGQFDGSHYIMSLQSQLCKSLHQMGIMEKQIWMVDEGIASMRNYAKDTIQEVLNEKSKMEEEHNNEMLILEKDMDEFVRMWERKIEGIDSDEDEEDENQRNRTQDDTKRAAAAANFEETNFGSTQLLPTKEEIETTETKQQKFKHSTAAMNEEKSFRHSRRKSPTPLHETMQPIRT